MGKTLASTRMLVVEEARPAHFEKLVALFDACGCACHCRYWHFGGTKNEWIERCALRPEENRSELEAALASHDDSARGLVAMDENEIVGWMKLAPRHSLPKLRNLPVYRSLDLGSDDGVHSIGCFLIHPAHRRRGVARALVSHAAKFALARGGKMVEAYPHTIDRTMYDEEAWMGPSSLFASAGFTHEQGELPYPVMRLRVPGAHAER